MVWLFLDLLYEKNINIIVFDIIHFTCLDMKGVIKNDK